MPRKKPAVAPKHAPPRRRPKPAVEERKHLTENEVEQIRRAAARTGRHGHRDATMVLLAYRHGLRSSEIVDLRWEQVDFDRRVLHVRRRKKGSPSTHPLTRGELAALRKLGPSRTGYVFTTERRGPLSVRRWHELVQRAGKAAGLDIQTHPHMFRHGCGYALANEGRDTRAIQDYLGHRNIQHTVTYTKLASSRFDGFFED